MREIADAIRQAMDGGAPMTPKVARMVLDRFARVESGRYTPDESHLTARERQILDLLADGLIKKEIAARMSISVHTVNTYVRRIYEKLEVTLNMGAFVRRAPRLRLHARPRCPLAHGERRNGYCRRCTRRAPYGWRACEPHPDPAVSRRARTLQVPTAHQRSAQGRPPWDCWFSGGRRQARTGQNAYRLDSSGRRAVGRNSG
ncbi:MAG: response regulator transcription factor [Acidobacteria bacterium]|nr:response regulator transcription factor [Acidobacteriota bacterium]